MGMDKNPDGSALAKHQPPPSRLSEILEIAKAGAGPLLKRLEGAVGLELYREIVSEAAARSRELEAEQFFRLVAKHAEADHVIDLAVDLAEGLDQPHIYKAVAEGFENMRHCFEEPAKECMAVLVAQEIHDTSMPTEYFRACSAIISSMSVDVLIVVRDMLEAWLGIWLPDDLEPLLCRAPYSRGRLWFAQSKTRDLEYVRSIRTDMNEWFRYSPFYDMTPDFRRALACLRDADFGWEPEGHHRENGVRGIIPSRCFEWNLKRLKWARQLVRCLGPLPRDRTRLIRFANEE